MSHSRSLYEPELVERWNERYRNFALDEMVRHLRDMQRKLTDAVTSSTADKDQRDAA